MSSVLERVRRRKLVQWALAYGAAAWIVLQLVDVLGPRWGMGEGVQRAIDVLLVAGLAITLVFAWYHGEKGRQTVSGAELALIALLAGVTGLLLSALGPSDERTEAAITPGPAVAALDPLAIAVLPFRNLTGPEDRFLSDGLTDELITRLHEAGVFRKVISFTSSQRFRDSETSIRAIADSLGVGSVVEGSVQRVGGRIKVVAQLIDARTDGHIWTETYDDKTEREIFDIQTEITLSIAQELSAALSPGTRDRLSAIPTEDMDAWFLYLRGREAWRRRGRADLQEAERLFLQAIEADSAFADVWAGLANLYTVQFEVYDVAEAADAGIRAARRALALDSTRAEAYTALATIMWWRARERGEEDPTEVEDLFRKALELNPQYATGHQWYGGWLSRRAGRYEEGVREIEQALELDPLAAGAWGELAQAHLTAGDLRRCLDAFDRAAELSPAFPLAGFRIRLNFALGRWETGFRRLLETRGRRPGDFEAPVRAALAEGAPETRFRDLFIRWSESAGASGVELAVAYVDAGRLDDAIRVLEQVDYRRDRFARPLLTDSVLAPLRDDPRFQRIRSRVER